MRVFTAIALALALLAAGPPAAAKGESGCAPLGYDRLGLSDLKGRGFAIEDSIERQRFAIELLDCLGEPDPALRDGIAYEGFATLLRAKLLSPDTVRRLRVELLSRLDDRAADPLGVRRPFAALVLSEVARADRIEAIFTAEERAELVDRGAAYLRAIDDYRGFDSTAGWRHGVAHGADLLLQLTLNSLVDEVQLTTIRDAVAAQVAPVGEHFYVYGEAGRLARPILYMARRGAVSAADWEEWFAALAAPTPLVSWGEVFSSQAGLARLHNTRAFAEAIYVEAKESGEADLEPLAVGAVELLRALP